MPGATERKTFPVENLCAPQRNSPMGAKPGENMSADGHCREAILKEVMN
jgi:hypothetical protein